MAELRSLQSCESRDKRTAHREIEAKAALVSEQDSFINEVTEEVRKDRLYALYRRYGWIAAVAVVLLVGGAAVNEWRKASAEAQAQAAGDVLLTALREETPEGRVSALAGVEVSGEAGQRAIILLIKAAAEVEADNPGAARDILEGLAGDESAPQRFRDLATLKSTMLAAGTVAPEQRIARLSPIAIPGSPYRLLALEQIALAEVESGDADKALDTLTRIWQDADATQDLRRRVSQLIVALGGELAAT